MSTRTIDFGELIYPSGRYRARIDIFKGGEIKFPVSDSTFENVLTNWAGHAGGSVSLTGGGLHITTGAILTGGTYIGTMRDGFIYKLNFTAGSTPGMVTISGDNSKVIGTYNSSGSKEFIFTCDQHGGKLIFNSPGNTFVIDNIYLVKYTQVKFIDWGDIDYGYPSENPTYLYPPEFDWSFRLQSHELPMYIDLVDQLRTLDSRLTIEKYSGSSWGIYMTGLIDKSSVSVDKQKREIRFSVLGDLHKLKEDIQQTDIELILEARISFQEWVEQNCFGEEYAPVVSWVSKWWVVDEHVIDQPFENLLIRGILFRRIGAPFITYGDFFKALLNSIASTAIAEPGNKITIIPFRYNGSSLYRVPSDKIINHIWYTESAQNKIAYKVRQSTSSAYDDESYLDGQYPDSFSESEDVELIFPFSCSAVHDEWGITGASNSVYGPEEELIMLDTVTTLDRAGGIYTHSDPAKRNFKDLALEIFFEVNYKDLEVHELTIAGIAHEFGKFWAFENVAFGQYYAFTGKVFRVRDYTISHRRNETKVELIEA